jgi:polyhydroxybutyrate depolymerase
MKKLFTLIAILCLTASVFAQTQTPRTLTWDATEREYLEYVPSIYSAETPAPVIFCLHGLGDNMSNFSGLGFSQIAEQTGWIVITPQALVASFPVIGEIGTAWNSGAGAMGTPLGNLILNEDVDDTGFLMAILDSLENNFNINTDSVFFMGFSMGGFMSNRLACEEGDRITAVASVSGTLGVGFTPNPQFPVKSLHFHGTADTQVGYTDAEFDTGMGIYSVGMGAEELVEFWRNYNACDVEPLMTYFPDTEADGKTFERYFYQNGTDGVFTAFIKVIGGDHEWYYTPQNDIDYTTEIYKFFTNTMDFPSNVENQAAILSDIYPNPASNFINIGIDNANVSIFDITGKLVLNNTSSNNQTIDISSLSEGMYIVKLNNDGKISEQKLHVVR